MDIYKVFTGFGQIKKNFFWKIPGFLQDFYKKFSDNLQGIYKLCKSVVLIFTGFHLQGFYKDFTDFCKSNLQNIYRVFLSIYRVLLINLQGVYRVFTEFFVWIFTEFLQGYLQSFYRGFTGFGLLSKKYFQKFTEYLQDFYRLCEKFTKSVKVQFPCKYDLQDIYRHFTVILQTL